MFSKPSLEILSKLSFGCWSARLQIEFFQVLFQFATESIWSKNGVNEAPKTPKANEMERYSTDVMAHPVIYVWLCFTKGWLLRAGLKK